MRAPAVIEHVADYQLYKGRPRARSKHERNLDGESWLHLLQQPSNIRQVELRRAQCWASKANAAPARMLFTNISLIPNSRHAAWNV